MNPEAIGTWVAAAFTLMVLSYIISDNPLYKVAEHVFVGASIGWTFVLLFQNVLVGGLFAKLQVDPVGNILLLIPLLLGVLLLFRSFDKLAWLGNTSLAFVIGAGAALALVGAAVGLLLPQTLATVLPVIPDSWTWAGLQPSLNNLAIVVGVISTFLYFHFTGKQLGRFGKPVAAAAHLGKYVMMIAFGAIFASIAISRISLLVGRISFLLDVVR